MVDAGFEIVEAETGDAAYRMLERDSVQLLLTDINMPGRLDGIELAKLARVRHPGLPVLFITGRPDGAIRAQKIDKPCAVLHKPFNFAEVLATVQRLASGDAPTPC